MAPSKAAHTQLEAAALDSSIGSELCAWLGCSAGRSCRSLMNVRRRMSLFSKHQSLWLMMWFLGLMLNLVLPLLASPSRVGAVRSSLVATAKQRIYSSH